jgi:enamine deaminase RidA (YjgF/YER057c/UK114 family)
LDDAHNRLKTSRDVHSRISIPSKPATTAVQAVRLATDPRCLVEINAIAVID